MIDWIPGEPPKRDRRKGKRSSTPPIVVDYEYSFDYYEQFDTETLKRWLPGLEQKRDDLVKETKNLGICISGVLDVLANRRDPERAATGTPPGSPQDDPGATEGGMDGETHTPPQESQEVGP